MRDLWAAVLTMLATTRGGHTPIKKMVYQAVPFGIPNWYCLVYQIGTTWYTNILIKIDDRKWEGELKNQNNLLYQNGIQYHLVYQIGTTWYTKWYYLV